MNRLSEVAKDYLNDCDVLADARNQFEEQLADWWRELLAVHIVPRLTSLNQGKAPKSQDQNNQPGRCRWWADDDEDFYLELRDPRRNNTKYYTVKLRVGSQPALRELANQKALVGVLSDLAREWKVSGEAGLTWDQRTLAEDNIELLPDEPEVTAKQLCDCTERYFRVVIGYHRATTESAEA